MTPGKLLLVNALLPGAVSLVIVLLVWWRRVTSSVLSSFATALALAAAYIASHALILELEIRPTEVTQWLPWFVAGAGLAGVAITALRVRRLAAAAIRLAFAAFVTFEILKPLAAEWSKGEVALQCVLLGGALWLVWTVLDHAALVSPGPPLPHALLAVAMAAIGTFFYAGMGSQAQLAGAMAAAIGGTCIVSLVRREFTLAGGGAAVLSVFLVAATANVYHYAYRTQLHLALLVPALLLPGVVISPRVRRLSPLWQTVIAVSAALVPSVAALLLSVAAAPDSIY